MQKEELNKKNKAELIDLVLELSNQSTDERVEALNKQNEELAKQIEELSKQNEELKAINNELMESNSKLATDVKAANVRPTVKVNGKTYVVRVDKFITNDAKGHSLTISAQELVKDLELCKKLIEEKSKILIEK